MPVSPSEVRAKIAEAKAKEQERAAAEAAITAPNPVDPALTAVGQSAQPVMAQLPELVTPSVVGGTVGSLVGARVGAPKIGSGVGTAIGAGVETAMEGGSLGEVAAAVPVGFAEGVASEFVGDKMSRLWRAGKSRIFRKAKVGALPREGSFYGRAIEDAKELHEHGKFIGREIERDARALRRAGGKPPMTPKEMERVKQGLLSPAELTEGDLLDQLEAYGKSSMTGGSLRRLKTTRDKAFRAYADAYKRTLGELESDPAVLAKFVNKKIKRHFAARKGRYSAKYETVMSAVGDEPVNFVPAYTEMRPVIEAWEARAALSPDRQNLQPIVSRLKRFVEPVKDAEGNIIGQRSAPLTLREAQQLRSDWLEAQRALSTTKSKALGVTKRTVREIDKAIDGVLSANDQKRGTRLQALYKEANADTARYYNRRKRLQVGALVELVDEKRAGKEAVRQILPDGISTSNVNLLRNTLGGETSPEWGRVRRWYGEHLVDKYVSANRLDFRGLRNALEEVGEGEAAKAREILGKDYYDKLLQFAKLGDIATARGQVGSKVAVNIAETSALLALSGSVYSMDSGGLSEALTAGGAVAVPLWMLNRWLANPKTADLVLTGMKGKGGLGWSRQMSALLTRTVAEMGMNEYTQIESIPKAASRDELREQNRSFGRIQ